MLRSRMYQGPIKHQLSRHTPPRCLSQQRQHPLPRHRLPINQNRREKELPDLIQCAIDDGEDVRSFDIGEGYVNINTPDDIEIAEREYAEHFTPGASGK